MVFVAARPQLPLVSWSRFCTGGQIQMQQQELARRQSNAASASAPQANADEDPGAPFSPEGIEWDRAHRKGQRNAGPHPPDEELAKRTVFLAPVSFP